MEKVKWGVIGDALIGRAKVIPAMQKSQHCDIVGLASRDLAKAQNAAAAAGIPKAYGSYEDLLADPEIEAVYIPLPNHLHVPWAIKAAEAGKHVLCEKPIALTAEEAKTLIAVRERTGMMIQEAFMVRTTPQWLRTRELVQSGAIGELRAIQWIFTYMLTDPQNVRNMADIGGGGLYDIGCYPITTCRFVTGQEPKRIVSLINRDPNFGTDRVASAVMDFGSVQAVMTVSTQLAPAQRATFYGTEGRVEVQIPCNTPNEVPTRIFIDDGSTLDGSSTKVETFDTADQYSIQGDEFSRAIRGEREQPVPLENSIANMRVIDAAFRSSESGGWEAV